MQRALLHVRLTLQDLLNAGDLRQRRLERRQSRFDGGGVESPGEVAEGWDGPRETAAATFNRVRRVPLTKQEGVGANRSWRLTRTSLSEEADTRAMAYAVKARDLKDGMDVIGVE